jgi:hypothetical protein
MASTLGTPVLFAKEKNIWILSARIVFDANGAAALDTTQSKGFCAVWQNTPTFTAGTNGSSSLLGSVSSFQGIFPGMNLTIGSSLAIITTATVGSISAANAALNKFAVTAANNAQNGWPQFDTPSVTFVAGSAGGATGQYILQLGQQAAQRLDTYNKLLMVQHSFDGTTSSGIGGVGQRQLVPAAPSMLLIQNKTQVRTVPPTLATNSTDASITVQFGSGFGNSFSAGVPAAGEAVRIVLVMGNSTAP